MILKSYIVEQNLEILKTYSATLLYGENQGIKDDIKNKLEKTNSNAEFLNLFEEEIIKNKNILYENIINDSLFNDTTIIFIQGASDKIFNQISESLNKIKTNIKIYIFSENLDKKSKLRNLFEKSKNFSVVPCYEDNERTLVNYITKELYGYKGLTGEIINLIINNSNMNRKAIQNEILKIKDFFVEKKITKENIIEILNIKNNANFEELRDKALNGEKNKINKLLSEIEILNDDCFFYLNNINYRIMKLLEIRKKNRDLSNFDEVINSIKPPIFWKDKPSFNQQLKKWNLDKLNKAVSKITDTEILMKKNSYISNEILIKDLIINLSNEAFSASQ